MEEDETCLQVYKSKYSKTNKQSTKVLVFDLDETLGSFGELNILWCAIKHVRKITPVSSKSEENRDKLMNIDELQREFNEILDLYPEFLRYGIINILDFLLQKKLQGVCDKIYIYTNNICKPPWVTFIINYFKYKLDSPIHIFDKAICAFKINNRVIEINRTSKEKTYSDFIKCTLLPKNTEICFIDNNYYSNMVHDRVYYIQPVAYYHNLTNVEIIDRFMISEISSRFSHIFDKTDTFKDFIIDWFDCNNRNLKIQKIPKSADFDVFVTQKMMYHIRDFFYCLQRRARTKKNKVVLGRVTRKRRK